MKSNIKNILKELGFRENEIKTYLALTQLGEAPASSIAKNIGLPRTTVISILSKLEEEGYLTSHRYRGKIYYWVESPRVIGDVFKNKVELADSLEKNLSELYRKMPYFPNAKIYDTKKGITGFTEKLLLHTRKKSIIYTIDAPKEGNYIKVFSDQLETMFYEIKKRRQLFTKTLVPKNSVSEISGYKLEKQNIEIRELPLGVNFESSIWIIDDSVYFFSGNPPFLTAINHKVIANSTKSLFDYFWNNSSKI